MEREEKMGETQDILFMLRKSHLKAVEIGKYRC
jgi:hypothetical protein